MNIDKLIHGEVKKGYEDSFGSLMNIDKLIPESENSHNQAGFGSLMNIDKLILEKNLYYAKEVLAL